jgi:hypothetical protein
MSLLRHKATTYPRPTLPTWKDRILHIQVTGRALECKRLSERSTVTALTPSRYSDDRGYHQH